MDPQTPGHEAEEPQADDATLGGYFRVHDRPPAYSGSDGHPYTVSVEVERTGDLRAPYTGYLVFPKWAATGVGIVGHVETPTLVSAGTEGEVRVAIGERSLLEVQNLLEEAIARRDRDEHASAPLDRDEESPPG